MPQLLAALQAQGGHGAPLPHHARKHAQGAVCAVRQRVRESRPPPRAPRGPSAGGVAAPTQHQQPVVPDVGPGPGRPAAAPSPAGPPREHVMHSYCKMAARALRDAAVAFTCSDCKGTFHWACCGYNGEQLSGLPIVTCPGCLGKQGKPLTSCARAWTSRQILESGLQGTVFRAEPDGWCLIKCVARAVKEEHQAIFQSAVSCLLSNLDQLPLPPDDKQQLRAQCHKHISTKSRSLSKAWDSSLFDLLPQALSVCTRRHLLILEMVQGCVRVLLLKPDAWETQPPPPPLSEGAGDGASVEAANVAPESTSPAHSVHSAAIIASTLATTPTTTPTATPTPAAPTATATPPVTAIAAPPPAAPATTQDTITITAPSTTIVPIPTLSPTSTPTAELATTTGVAPTAAFPPTLPASVAGGGAPMCGWAMPTMYPTYPPPPPPVFTGSVVPLQPAPVFRMLPPFGGVFVPGAPPLHPGCFGLSAHWTSNNTPNTPAASPAAPAALNDGKSNQRKRRHGSSASRAMQLPKSVLQPPIVLLRSMQELSYDHYDLLE
eukprot:m.295701 g.295701  ORF g.295701 m.295701 type:complete len:549 (-) comp22972_c9_seq1:84-1730(-)